MKIETLSENDSQNTPILAFSFQVAKIMHGEKIYETVGLNTGIVVHIYALDLRKLKWGLG